MGSCAAIVVGKCVVDAEQDFSLSGDGRFTKRHRGGSTEAQHSRAETVRT